MQVVEVHHWNALFEDDTEISDYTDRTLQDIISMVSEGACPCKHPSHIPLQHLDRSGICPHCGCTWLVAGDYKDD